MPPNIIHLHVSVLSIGHLQVFHNLLISYAICLLSYYWQGGETRSRTTILGGTAMPPNIIQLHVSVLVYWLSSGSSQLNNQLYNIYWDLLLEGGGRDEISSYNVGRPCLPILYNYMFRSWVLAIFRLFIPYSSAKQYALGFTLGGGRYLGLLYWDVRTCLTILHNYMFQPG